MTRLYRVPGLRSVRRGLRPAAAAAGLATALVGAAALAGTGAAATNVHAHNTSFKAAGINAPTLSQGVLKIEGTNGADKIALRLQNGDPAILQVDFGDDGSADFSFRRENVAKIELDTGNGDDLARIDETNGIFSDTIPTTLDGGNGNDTLTGGSGAVTLLGGNGNDNLVGGNGAETLDGGNGNDTIDGNRGNDVALMGNGDDTFVWDPGDGSDSIEGGNGSDTMVFNGANAAEHIDLSANGPRLRFFRDVATITMDTNSVEQVDFNALGGADVVTVNDLTGTDVTGVNVDLAAALGGAAGDGSVDRVVVNGRNGNDSITVSGDAGGVKVSGLAATVGVLHAEAANDRLEINTPAGQDSVHSGGLAGGVIQLLVNGVLVP
jgi:Ca2+-binding RTX toxin-like protein